MIDRSTWRALAALAAAVVLTTGCAARAPARPAGTPAADPAAADAFTAATAGCRGLRTFTAEIGLSGRAGDQRIRGRLLAGFAAPASARLEGVAPFGAPVFILAAADGRGTLLFPRDNRVLPEADVEDMLDGLTGLALGADDLRLLLSGCLADAASPEAGRAWPGGWSAVDLGDGRTAYLRSKGGATVLAAADYGDWRVDYAAHANGFPREVRVRASDPARRVDLTARLNQLEVNVPLDAEAFSVRIPERAERITLADLRQMAPWR